MRGKDEIKGKEEKQMVMAHEWGKTEVITR